MYNTWFNPREIWMYISAGVKNMNAQLPWSITWVNCILRVLIWPICDHFRAQDIKKMRRKPRNFDIIVSIAALNDQQNTNIWISVQFKVKRNASNYQEHTSHAQCPIYSTCQTPLCPGAVHYHQEVSFSIFSQVPHIFSSNLTAQKKRPCNIQTNYYLDD